MMGALSGTSTGNDQPLETLFTPLSRAPEEVSRISEELVIRELPSLDSHSDEKIGNFQVDTQRWTAVLLLSRLVLWDNGWNKRRHSEAYLYISPDISPAPDPGRGAKHSEQHNSRSEYSYLVYPKLGEMERLAS